MSAARTEAKPRRQNTEETSCGRFLDCVAAIAGAAAVAAIGLTGSAAAASCESLAGKTFEHATIAAANAIVPPFSVMALDPPAPVAVNAPFCRVQGILKPSADSDIKFEVWLPPATAWNGKYQGVGNGGFAGSLIYNAMVWALDGGYAVSGTDTGHAGGSLDSAWALGHPEKITDFGWRAIHETATASQGDRRGPITARGAGSFLFRRLFGRRTGSADGSAALPEGL